MVRKLHKIPYLRGFKRLVAAFLPLGSKDGEKRVLRISR